MINTRATLKEVGCCTCQHLLSGTRECNLLCFFEDGGWGAFCGNDEHAINADSDTADLEDLTFVHLLEIVDDATFNEVIAVLEPGRAAVRPRAGAPWKFVSLDDLR